MGKQYSGRLSQEYNCGCYGVSIIGHVPLVRLSQGRLLQMLPWFLWERQIDVVVLAQSGRTRA